ncbi:MAG: hypothetical protein U0L66_09595 [Acutalibacteraceae bacterium]|nr:hypothetical protein [Acutalibacteraceae bacterium]
MAEACYNLGDRQKALEICDKLFNMNCNLKETVIDNIAFIYETYGLSEKAEAIRKRKANS